MIGPSVEDTALFPTAVGPTQKRSERQTIRMQYLARRTLLFVLIVAIAFSLNFLLPRLLPGNPVQDVFQTLMGYSGTYMGDMHNVVNEYNAKFGLNQPLWKQYINYWDDVFHLRLGYSIVNFPETVGEIIRAALPWTLALLLTSSFLSFFLGSLLGALLPWRGTPRGFVAFIPILMTFAALPPFLLGLVLIFLFVVLVHWFPSGGGIDPGVAVAFTPSSILNILKHAILPALSLVFASVGFWALQMRGMMTTVVGEDYITFAKARGIRSRRIFMWYGVRTAMLPQITALVMGLGHVVSGAILVEAIFSYPGIGGKLYQAIGAKDLFVIQGIAVIVILATAFSLLVLDLLYPFIDPRIRVTAGR